VTQDLSALSVRELQKFIEVQADQCAAARQIVAACEDALAQAHAELKRRLVTTVARQPS
jgi:hypothetical protein